MRRYLYPSAMAIVIGLVSGSASAQDVFDWSGLYVGGAVGVASNATDLQYTQEYSGESDYLQLPGQSCDVVGLCVLDFHSADGSVNWVGHAGVSVQHEDAVFGVEGDFRLGSSADLRIEHSSGSSSWVDELNVESSIGWSSTFRAIAGTLVSDRALVYATAGIAVGNLVTDVQRVCDNCEGDYSIDDVSNSHIDSVSVGWALGSGVEIAVNKNWSLRGQYMYIDLSQSNELLPAYGHIPDGSLNAHFSSQSLTLGLNYRF